MILRYFNYKPFIMNLIKNNKRFLSPFLFSKYIRYFNKPNNEQQKKQKERNENYITTKGTPNKQINKEQTSQKISQFPFINPQDLRMLILCNTAFMGGIPFWAPLNVGICLANGCYILSKIGSQTKNFLLLINNNQMQQLNTYRPLNDYLKINFAQTLLLLSQSLTLAFVTNQTSIAFNMMWIGISIKQKILPSYFYLLLIPLFLSIFMNLFSDPIRSFLLNQQQIKSPQDKKEESS